MRYKFRGTAEILVEHKEGMQKPLLKESKFSLEISDNLEKSMYLDNDGEATELGVKTLTNTFVQALVGNIHSSHQKGQWDSANHLRYIISELERGFVQQVKIEKGTF